MSYTEHQQLLQRRILQQQQRWDHQGYEENSSATTPPNIEIFLLEDVDRIFKSLENNEQCGLAASAKNRTNNISSVEDGCSQSGSEETKSDAEAGSHNSRDSDSESIKSDVISRVGGVRSESGSARGNETEEESYAHTQADSDMPSSMICFDELVVIGAIELRGEFSGWFRVVFSSYTPMP